MRREVRKSWASPGSLCQSGSRVAPAGDKRRPHLGAELALSREQGRRNLRRRRRRELGLAQPPAQVPLRVHC